MMRIRSLISAVAVVLGLGWFASPAAAASGPCPRVAKKVFDTGDADELARFGPAKERLLRIKNLVGQEEWSRVANDLIDLVDPNVPLADRLTVHTWIRATTNSSVTDAELASAIMALDRLRDSSGRLHVGLLLKAGTGDGSTRWMATVATGNRGHFYEVISARNLVNSGYVNPNRIVGFGIKMRGVEGDLVEALDNGLRFIDSKAANGNFLLQELDNVFDALTDPNSPIKEFVFAVEGGTSLPGPWVNKLQDLNDILVNTYKLPPINVVAAGTF